MICRIVGPTGRRGPLSTWAETNWLPILGPTAYVAARRLYGLGIWFGEAGFCLDEHQLGQALGVPGRDGQYLRNGLNRLVKFGVAKWDGDILEIAAEWPEPRHRLRIDPTVDVSAAS